MREMEEEQRRIEMEEERAKREADRKQRQGIGFEVKVHNLEPFEGLPRMSLSFSVRGDKPILRLFVDEFFLSSSSGSNKFVDRTKYNIGC